MTIICPSPLCARPELPELSVSDEWDYVLLPNRIPIIEQSWPEGTRPLVSIHCNTYNHEKYIEQAIEGFLMQETTFPVQIFVHDDASSDKTASIISEYEALYPNLFLVVLQPINIYSRGIRREVGHLLFGKYIAYCEGDDYWTHPWKLQIQYSEMESNPVVSLSYHPVLVLDKDGRVVQGIESTMNPEGEDHLRDLALRGNYIHTPSVMIKNLSLLWPSEFKLSPVGDYCMWIQMLQYGKLLIIPSSMAVYRYGSGMWSSQADAVRFLDSVSTFLVLAEYLNKNAHPYVSVVLEQRARDYASRYIGNIQDSHLAKWNLIGSSGSSLAEYCVSLLRQHQSKNTLAARFYRRLKNKLSSIIQI